MSIADTANQATLSTPGGGEGGVTWGPSDTELRMLLVDCVTLWGINARITISDACIDIAAQSATFRIERAPPDLRPVRWLLHRPNRPPRVAPSIVALLAALRNALGAEAGSKLRIGASSS